MRFCDINLGKISQLLLCIISSNIAHCTWTDISVLRSGMLMLKHVWILVKFVLKSQHIHSRKQLWKCCMQNGGHFVSMSQHVMMNFKADSGLVPSPSEMPLHCDVSHWLGASLEHYNDVIMTTMASQITSLLFVYSFAYSDADQRKYQSSTSLAFVWGSHRDRWIPCTKGQLRRKCFHLMTSSWSALNFVELLLAWCWQDWIKFWLTWVRPTVLWEIKHRILTNVLRGTSCLDPFSTEEFPVDAMYQRATDNLTNNSPAVIVIQIK